MQHMFASYSHWGLFEITITPVRLLRGGIMDDDELIFDMLEGPMVIRARENASS